MPLTARADSLVALGNRELDLLVVGGGITGCGVARDAALRGLRVALVEKGDFASGTSSRSTRLVHGGIRYLEHGHLGLVYESSAERRRLLELAPHLVRPLSFTWPVYAGSRIGAWKLNAGLALYDALSLFRNVGRHKRLTADDILEREPQLRRDGLTGGASYFDAATDDARLTLVNALGALEAGALVLNYAELRRLERAGDGALVAGVVDVLEGTERRVRARTVVNAAGPWSDAVRRLEEAAAAGTGDARGAPEPAVRGSTGAHVAVARERIGNRGALTLLSPADGRVMFVLPDGPLAVIGTTETPTPGSADDVRATGADVSYLLQSANRFFPAAALTPDDVVSAWAGIRPLAATTASEDLGRASREHVISQGPAGVITVTGGKLTTYRVMSAEIVDAVERRLQRPVGRAPTRNTVLPGGDLLSFDAAVAGARDATGANDIGLRLVRAYGSAWRVVWDTAGRTKDGTSRLVPTLPYILGEMVYAVERELAQTIGDLLIRRTRIAFETRDHGLSVAPLVARLVAPLLGWDPDRIRLEVTHFSDEVARLFTIEY